MPTNYLRRSSKRTPPHSPGLAASDAAPATIELTIAGIPVHVALRTNPLGRPDPGGPAAILQSPKPGATASTSKSQLPAAATEPHGSMPKSAGLYYWAEDERLILVYGPTPISGRGEIRLPRPCNLIGRTSDDLAVIAQSPPGPKSDHEAQLIHASSTKSYPPEPLQTPSRSRAAQLSVPLAKCRPFHRRCDAVGTLGCAAARRLVYQQPEPYGGGRETVLETCSRNRPAISLSRSGNAEEADRRRQGNRSRGRDHPAAGLRDGRRRDPPLLLPRAPVDRRQLPHVPRRGGRRTQTRCLLRPDRQRSAAEPGRQSRTSSAPRRRSSRRRAKA